jgi:phosphoserine phosphatase
MNLSPTDVPRRLPLDDLHRRLDGLLRLLETTRSLAAEIDLATILTIVTHEACRALDCERASLFQYDRQREELFTSVATELEIAEIRSGLDQGITGMVARTLEVANVPDPHHDPRWNPAWDQRTGFQTRNILAAPLVSLHDGALLGVLQLLNKREGAFDAFDEELIQAFSQHAAIALDRARVVEELQRQQATRTSLGVAREIQRGFMPSQVPQAPGYELATWWLPNEAVGGDYCDVVPLRDGRLGLVVADVSGHGLGPALLMASVRAALRALAIEHSDPCLLLRLLGRSLAADLQEGRFITLVLGALNPQSHLLEYANAGHAPALHYAAATQSFSTLEPCGFPFGVVEDPEYHASSPVALAPGDMVLLCTDGIVETVDSEHRVFGLERLKDFVRQHAGEPASVLVRHIGESVTAHCGGATPADDLTILALRRTP